MTGRWGWVVMRLYFHRSMTKPTKLSVCLAQTDQSSLCAQWVAKDPRFLHADSEGTGQTGGCAG